MYAEQDLFAYLHIPLFYVEWDKICMFIYVYASVLYYGIRL